MKPGQASKRGQAYTRELNEYEYRKLRSAALFVFEEWNQQRFDQGAALLRPFGFPRSFLRRACTWPWTAVPRYKPGWRRYEGAAHASRCESKIEKPVLEPDLFDDVLRRWSLLSLACALRVLFATILYASDTIARCGRVGSLSASLVAILIENGLDYPGMVELIFISLMITSMRPKERLCVLRRAARAALTCRNVVFLAMICRALGAGDEHHHLKCGQFDGINSTWVAWLISFTAWVAYKDPKLTVLLSGGAATKPTAADPANPTAAELEALTEWSLLNIKLYGSILLHLSGPLQASVFTESPSDGVGAVQYLRSRFGASTSGDRAEATARLQATHIDKRAGLS